MDMWPLTGLFLLPAIPGPLEPVRFGNSSCHVFLFLVVDQLFKKDTVSVKVPWV